MCAWGDTILVIVPIPAHLSCTGEARWAEKPIDRCLAPLVQALNAAGILTAGCCCGHGRAEPTIALHDGRVVLLSTVPTLAPESRDGNDTESE